MLWSTDGWVADLVTKLRQGLPLAITTTIVMSLLVAFWKKLLKLGKRMLGLEEPPKEELSRSFPEGEIAHCYGFKSFRTGFSVATGWRGAVVDKGMVQQELDSGRYRRRAVRKMIDRLALSEASRVIVWRDSEFPSLVTFDNLFAADHQPMQLEMRCVFRLKSADLLHSSLEEITLPLDEIAEHVSERIAVPVRSLVASIQGDDPYVHRDRLPEWAEGVKNTIASALQDSPFEIVRVADLRVFSPALDQVFGSFGDLSRDSVSARTEIERNRVRGALRQSINEGKLAEMRDQSQFEDAVRAIQQEEILKGKALRQELGQCEIAELEQKLAVWKRKQALLIEMLGPAGVQNGAEASHRIVEDLRRVAVDSPGSPFTAQERQQICALLQAVGNKSARPEEIIAAVSKGADIPHAVLDPLAHIRGPHTLHVGEGWKVFDGDSLWQVRLTGIATRRHGFLWRRESPSRAHFELRASPGNRRFDQDVALDGQFALEIGANRIPMEYLGGTPSRISVRVPASC
jgi:hypothetical protein